MSFTILFTTRKTVLLYTILIFIVWIQTSCSQEEEMAFIPLSKMDFKGKVANEGKKEVLGIYKYFLIENVSDRNEIRIEKIQNYADSIVQNSSRVDESVKEYTISFYKKSDRTEEFITTKKNFYTAQHDLTNLVEDFIASYEMINCFEDEYKKKWILRVTNPYTEIVVKDECK